MYECQVFGGTPIALLSLNKTATASATESGRSPSHGNDGNSSTRWTASGGGYPQWWKVDLGAVQTITKAVILWESSASRSYKYLIEISDDDVTYATLVDQSARTARRAPPHSTTAEFPPLPMPSTANRITRRG